MIRFFCPHWYTLRRTPQKASQEATALVSRRATHLPLDIASRWSSSESSLLFAFFLGRFSTTAALFPFPFPLPPLLASSSSSSSSSLSSSSSSSSEAKEEGTNSDDVHTKNVKGVQALARVPETSASLLSCQDKGTFYCLRRRTSARPQTGWCEGKYRSGGGRRVEQLNPNEIHHRSRKTSAALTHKTCGTRNPKASLGGEDLSAGEQCF